MKFTSVLFVVLAIFMVAHATLDEFFEEDSKQFQRRADILQILYEKMMGKRECDVGLCSKCIMVCNTRYPIPARKAENINCRNDCGSHECNCNIHRRRAFNY